MNLNGGISNFFFVSVVAAQFDVYDFSKYREIQLVDFCVEHLLHFTHTSTRIIC